MFGLYVVSAAQKMAAQVQAAQTEALEREHYEARIAAMPRNEGRTNIPAVESKEAE